MRTSTIKSIAALALTGVGSALVIGFRTSDGIAIPTAAGGTGSSGTTTNTTSGSGSSVGSGSTSGSGSGSGSGSSATGATYKDGTWTGAAVSEPWGPFQVQVVISNGTITNVSVVESPGDRHSRQINNQAVPMLTQATVADQASSVDMVSGATWTSDSYATSLQSALDKAAKAA